MGASYLSAPATARVNAAFVARAGATTGEWAAALREVFGEYRAPTGIGAMTGGADVPAMQEVRAKVTAAAERRGVSKLRLLLAKPGLDGHSNAAEQVATTGAPGKGAFYFAPSLEALRGLDAR